MNDYDIHGFRPSNDALHFFGVSRRRRCLDLRDFQQCEYTAYVGHLDILNNSFHDSDSISPPNVRKIFLFVSLYVHAQDQRLLKIAPDVH